MSPTPPRVLLIEDEPQMRRFLRAALDGNGFVLLEASTAAEGRTMAASYAPELILLDLGLPDGDGIALTQELRGWTRTPIIVISAQGREANKVQALDAGADDYLTKPFGVNELVARMRVALRHAAAVGETPAPVLEFGDVQLDLQRRVVTRAGAEVHLTPNEYRLFVALAQHAGKVLTHAHLLKEVWGPGSGQQTHYLRVYMAQLRQKLEPDAARPRLLLTEPGVGYRLKEPQPLTTS